MSRAIEVEAEAMSDEDGVYEDEDVYEVETLLGKRQRTVRGRTTTEYKVKWTGYTADEASWEPASNIHKDIRAAYNASLRDGAASEDVASVSSREDQATGKPKSRKRRKAEVPLDPTHAKGRGAYQTKPNRSRLV